MAVGGRSWSAAGQRTWLLEARSYPGCLAHSAVVSARRRTSQGVSKPAKVTLRGHFGASEVASVLQTGARQHKGRREKVKRL